MRLSPRAVASLLTLVLAVACGGGEPAPRPTPATEVSAARASPAAAAVAPGEETPRTPGSSAPTSAGADASTPKLPPSDLRADEVLRIFPALAIPDGEGGHAVELRIWVFEPEEDSPLRAAALGPLRRVLGLPEGVESQPIFRERARAFLVDNERGKRITVTIAGRDHTLAATAANGQSVTTLRFAAGELASGVTPVIARLLPGDARRFEGAIFPADPDGLSVVSDIDDTIKISEVGDRDRLLAATFTRPFEAVPTIAAVYGRWADAGALFHYVSASPWQLYDPLQAFADAAGFPRGSYHLKSFRAKDASLVALFQDPRAYKLAILRPLIAGSPGRRFVLVGDSGERDPEIYGALAREFGDAIAHIYIREVSGERERAPEGDARYREAFAGVPMDRWTIFGDAAELPPAPPRG